MTLTAFTSYDNVRAALGVTTKDLPDGTLGLSYYEDSLAEGLDDVHTSLVNAFEEAASADPQSDAQSRLVRSARLYATIVVAKAALPALRLAAPQQVTDGKAGMTRFNDPFIELERRIDDNCSRAKTKLDAALQEVLKAGSSRAARVWFSVINPDSDPVTGE